MHGLAEPEFRGAERLEKCKMLSCVRACTYAIMDLGGGSSTSIWKRVLDDGSVDGCSACASGEECMSEYV